MKRILITGGTGFFGKSMLDYRKRHTDIDWPEWLILSRDPDKFVEAYPDLVKQAGVSFVAGDVRNFSIEEKKLDGVVHAAALLDPERPADEISSVAIEGTRHIVDVARDTHCPKILFTSSGAVYGSRSAPVLETSKTEPTTPYGKAKLGVERLLIASGLDIRIARCFAFVGKYLDRTIYYAIGNFIRDALAGKDIVINGDGTPMRSYLYADDLVEWLFAILERGEPGRVYNVGSPEAISIRDLAQTVLDAAGERWRNEVEVDNGEPNQSVRVLGRAVPGAANYYVPNVGRITSELGVQVKVPLREAILRSC